MSVRLFDVLVTTEKLDAVFSDEALIAAMVRFETALARAEAAHDVIPREAAEAISRSLAEATFDVQAIASAARRSGTIAVPFVEMIRLDVRATEPSAAIYVHWGATSQDVTDTAMALCLMDARGIIDADHQRLASGLRQLSDAHASTVMLARTLLQPAVPTTFGLKVAGWYASVQRAYRHMDAAFEDARVLQLGGPAGTLASLGDSGLDVTDSIAAALQLEVPAAPWHTHRDRLASLVGACGVYAGTIGKIARDISLLMQHEVGEASEPGGGSSSMPHKRNPAGCAIAIAASHRLPGLVAAFLSAMLQEHERAVGGWHAEASIVSESVQATGSAAAAMADVVEGLTVDAERMAANLRATNGTVYAERAMTLLTPQLGTRLASWIVADALAMAAQPGTSFRDALAANEQAREALGAALTTLDEPESYLGSSEHFRRRLLNTAND